MPVNLMEEYNQWPVLNTDSESCNALTLHRTRSLLEGETLNVLNDLGNLLLRFYSLHLCGDESVLPLEFGWGETWNLTRIFRYSGNLKDASELLVLQ